MDEPDGGECLRPDLIGYHEKLSKAVPLAADSGGRMGTFLEECYRSGWLNEIRDAILKGKLEFGPKGRAVKREDRNLARCEPRR